MPRIRGEKKRQEKDDHNAPLHSPRASSINPSSVSESDWWENFSARFSGYTPDSLFKVSRKTFEYICGLVEEEMTTGQNYSDQRREYLALNDRVAIALTRLCTGESFEAVGNLFGVNISTAYQITWRFVEAIEKKGFHHLHWPKTEEKIMEIKSKFEGIRGLPNCCGAIDTTKIMFSLASDHAQRKIWCDQENNPCTILQAVVDPDMRFLDIMAGLPGCVSEPDALCEWSLFNLCEEGKRLNGKKLKLAESNKEIGEYIVGNGGFPLLPWLLTPYNEKKKPSDAQQDFNKRLYETMKVAKMAFERLKETWKIIQGVVWRPDKLRLPRIIYACCVLHNIMIDHNDGFILQDESLLQSNDDTSQAHQPKCKFLDKTASVQRDNLALYLSSKPPPFSGNGSESVSHFSALTDFSDDEIPPPTFPSDMPSSSTVPGSTSGVRQSSQGLPDETVAKEVPAVLISADPNAETVIDLTKDASRKDKKRKGAEAEAGKSDHSKRHKSKGRAMLDVDQNVDDISSWDDARVVDMNKKSTVLAMYVAAEIARRFKAASSDTVKADNDKLRLLVDEQKRTIARLESQLEAEANVVQTLEEKYKASELARLQAADGLEKAQGQVSELEDKVALMETDLENRRAEIQRLAPFEEERMTGEFLADIQTLMRKALRGGFVLAVNHLTAAGVDSSVLEKNRLYDPKAVDEYDRLLVAFRNRERIAKPKKTSTSETTPAPDSSTTPNPDPATATKDQA